MNSSQEFRFFGKEFQPHKKVCDQYLTVCGKERDVLFINVSIFDRDNEKKKKKRKDKMRKK